MAGHDEPTGKSPQLASTHPYTGPTPDAGSTRDALAFGVGARLGRYEIRRVVGAGGMGVVLAGHDAELGREVAIKVVASDSDDARARLVREAQAMAKLSHPNVVTVHEVMRLDGRAAIVMELVDGTDLGKWRNAKPRTWREIVEAYLQAGRGLAAAHRAGLVHRDFKPSNALVDRDGVVRVTDFGLVRSADPEPLDEARGEPAHGDVLRLDLTAPGVRMGTPAYMAPEQHAGELVDARSDQWSFACSLYEALWKQRPFAGETTEELSGAKSSGAIRPEPPAPKIPRRLRAAIRKAMARDPDDRFPSMQELLAELALSRPRRQLAAVIGGAVVVAGAIAFAVVSRGRAVEPCSGLAGAIDTVWNPARAADVRAAFAKTRAGYAAVAADRAVVSLDAYRAAWIDARTRACEDGRSGVRSADLLDRRMRCLDQRLAEVGELVTGLVAVAGIEVVSGAGGAIDRLSRIAECDDPPATEPAPTDAAARAEIARAETALARATALYGLAQYDASVPLVDEAVAIAERVRWGPLVGRAYLARGLNQSRRGEYDDSIASFDRAAAAATRAHDDVTVAEAVGAKFWVVAEPLGKPAQALASRQFVELALERAGQPKRPRALYLHNLAIVLLNQEKLDDALAAETESIALWRELVPEGHVNLLDSLQTEGNIHTMRGEHERARALLEEVLAAQIAARGPEHPLIADTLVNLGILAAVQADMVTAIDKLERAIAIKRGAHTDEWHDAHNLGVARYELGRYADALVELEEARTLASAGTGSRDTRNVAMAETALAAVLVETGDRTRARQLLEHAIHAAEIAGAPHEDTAAYAAIAAARDGDLPVAKAKAASAKLLAHTETAIVALSAAEVTRAVSGCKAAIAAYEHALEVAKAEPSLSVKGLASTALGECQLALGKDAAAIATLEPIVVWYEQVGADPIASQRARAALARAR
jgi:eukaryotic-like serine/threonine-protein kinase